MESPHNLVRKQAAIDLARSHPDPAVRARAEQAVSSATESHSRALAAGTAGPSLTQAVFSALLAEKLVEPL